MTKEDAARSENAQSPPKDALEERVEDLAALLTRACQDEKDQGVRVSALVEALACAIVDYAHNQEGQLIIEDILDIRDGVLHHIDKVSIPRHTLTRIAKDPSTITWVDSGRDPLADIIDALGSKERKPRGGLTATATPVSPDVAAAVLASILGRGKRG